MSSHQQKCQAATIAFMMAVALGFLGMPGCASSKAPSYPSTDLAASATAAPTATPTLADHKGNCPSYPVNQASFDRFGLTSKQRSFIMNAVHKARPQDRSQLHWAELSGHVAVFWHLNYSTPDVVLAYDQPPSPFDKDYRDPNAGHLVYMLNQGPDSECVAHAINPIAR